MDLEARGLSNMKEITVEFHVATKSIGSEEIETVTIEVPEDANEALIDKIVSEYFETWVWENVEATYEIKGGN